MLAGGKLLSFGLSTNWERELLRADLVRELGEERAAKIDPTYPKGNPVVLRPGHGFDGDGLGLAEQIGRVRDQIGLAAAASGSNNWAVSPSRSATGGALLAGDPHLPSGMPGVWYEIGLELDGRWCRGASIPGLPGISLGQNNDVAFSFTNVMADVEDLFVERITGESYEFQGEQRPLEIIEELISVRGQDQPERHEVRITHHGPIVNQALGADDQQPLALRWAALDEPSISHAHIGVLEPTSGPELVEMLRDVTMPVSNLVWADRHGSIGYKMMGSVPKRNGDCPDLPKPGWTGEFEWDSWIPYDEMPELVDPEEGFIVTANNRVVDDSYPHHITSDWLDGYRAARIEQLLRETEEHDLETFRRMQTDLYSIPGDEVVHRLARLQPKSQREVRAIERLKSWDRTLSPGTVAGTIYQAFLLRLAREFTRAAIGDRDLADRYLDRADNGFIAHVTSPWRWHSHLLALWEEGDEELIGGSWDELALDALRGALDDLEDRFGPDPEAWQWGHVHALQFPHALGGAHPVAEQDLQPHPAPGRRAGDRRPDRLRPERSLPRDLGPELADACGPGRAGALPVAVVHRAVGTRVEPALRRPAASLGGRRHPVDGRRGARSRRSCSRRSSDAVAAGPDQAHGRGAGGAARDRAHRGRLQQRRARLASLDAALVRAARRRDLDLDLREVPEGEEPRARLARDPADRDRCRVRRAARRPDRGRGRADPGCREDRRLRQGPHRPLLARESNRWRATLLLPSRRRPRSGWRSTSIRSASRPGTTASSAASTSPGQSGRPLAPPTFEDRLAPKSGRIRLPAVKEHDNKGDSMRRIAITLTPRAYCSREPEAPGPQY